MSFRSSISERVSYDGLVSKFKKECNQYHFQLKKSVDHLESNVANLDTINLASLTTDRSIDFNLPEIPGCNININLKMLMELTYASVERTGPPMIDPPQ